MARDVSLGALLRLTDTGVGGYYLQRFPCLDADAESPWAAVLDDALAALPDDERRCIELIVVARLSYRDAAAELDWYLSTGGLDTKRVWRLVQQGIKAMGAALGPIHAGDADTIGI